MSSVAGIDESIGRIAPCRGAAIAHGRPIGPFETATCKACRANGGSAENIGANAVARLGRLLAACEFTRRWPCHESARWLRTQKSSGSFVRHRTKTTLGGPTRESRYSRNCQMRIEVATPAAILSQLGRPSTKSYRRKMAPDLDLDGRPGHGPVLARDRCVCPRVGVPHASAPQRSARLAVGFGPATRERPVGSNELHNGFPTGLIQSASIPRRRGPEYEGTIGLAQPRMLRSCIPAVVGGGDAR